MYVAALRREQRAYVDALAPTITGNEAGLILGFARSAQHELAALLSARDARLLEGARDGEWRLRDLLRHAIAVELRYRAQVLWSVSRGDVDPLEIPPEKS